MKYCLEIHGCQMNHSDAERIRTVLQRDGYSEASTAQEADVIIFVTCSIKQKAEDKVISHFDTLRKMKTKKPHMRIGITGCMARITSNVLSQKKDPLLTRLKGLDFVFRIEDTSQLTTMLGNEMATEKNTQSVISYFEIAPAHYSSFQAYVPIMNGCNKFCTYCIVPYSRGREISRTMSNIIDEITTLVSNEYREITLLGQNVNSYGRTNAIYDSRYPENDLEPFSRLITEIDAIAGSFRLRFTSPHPQDMTEQAIATICSSRVMCNHVHLPLQSGDDAVLKRMNRSYNMETFRNIVKQFRDRKPDIAISTDIIVGFPGETMEQFENTVRAFREIAFDLAYISQFSPRKGTYAERNFIDDVPREEKTRRFHVLNDLLREISHAKNKSYLGKTVDVLVEKIENNLAIGKTSCYKTTHMPARGLRVGEFTRSKILAAKEWILEAIPVHS